VAIKTLTKNTGKSHLKTLLTELKIMIYLGAHENIAEFLGADTSELWTGQIANIPSQHN